MHIQADLHCHSIASTHAYSTINEGTGKGIRFGSCGQDTVDQLVWLEKVLGNEEQEALEQALGYVKKN